jgi:quercetin dioxygenase-like cupin family protein
MIQYRVDFNGVPWETPMPGVRFKVNKQGGKQLRFVEYTKDMPRHWCEKGHCGYVLEGQFEITFTDTVEVFNPGDGVFIPPGAEHKHMGKALTDVVRVIFVEEVEG